MFEVRRLNAATILARIFLAIAIASGTSGGALAAVLCSKATCGTACAMHASAEPQPASCCEKTPTKQAPDESSCKCQLNSAPIPAQSDPVGVAFEATSIVALLPETIEFNATRPRIESVLFLVGGDASPPIVVRHPDLGRAPPVR